MAKFPTVSLREVTTVITKGTTPTTLGHGFVESGINFIKAESVTLDGRIDESVFAHIDEATHEKLKRSQIDEGDILFSIAGMKLGKSAIAQKRHLPANTNQAVAIIRVDRTKAIPEFIHYFFLNPDHYRYVNALTAQAAQPNINLTQIGDLAIALPPLTVQRWIAGTLSAYDKLIENSQRHIEVVESMARALYREWFVHFRFPGHENHPLVASPLGEIPRDWEVKPLGEVATITMGLSPKGDTYNEQGDGTPLVNGPVEFGERFTKRVKWTTAPTKLCKEGDLVVCVRGSTTGRYVKSDGVYCLGRGVCGVSSEYQCFVDQLFENQLRILLAQTSGSTFPSWTGPQLRNHSVLSPPLHLRERFESLINPISAAVLGHSRQIENLRRTRDLLLPRLLSGQIEVDAA